MAKNFYKKLYYSIGLMSGTSMDQIDGIMCKTDGKNYFKLIEKTSLDYNSKTLLDLNHCINDPITSLQNKKIKKSR